MKKALTLLALLAVTALAAVVLAQSAAVSLKPAQTTVYEGSTTTITVHVAPTGATVFAGNVTITYDASGLEFVKAEPCEGVQFLSGFPKVEDGKVVIVFFTTQGISADQEVAVLEFKGKSEGEYKVEIATAGLADATGSDVPAVIAPGSTIIVKSKPTTTTTQSPVTVTVTATTTITTTTTTTTTTTEITTTTVTKTLTHTLTTTSVTTTTTTTTTTATKVIETVSSTAYALAVVAAIVGLAIGVIVGKKGKA